MYKQHLELGFDLTKFHEFCYLSISAGGLSGNMEERPTRQVYIEILTCTAIIKHLEDSRSHGNEQEADRAGGRAPALPPWAPTHL